jgi:hypothetical protein
VKAIPVFIFLLVLDPDYFASVSIGMKFLYGISSGRPIA